MCILLQKSVKLNAGAKNISKYFSKDLFYTEQKKVNFSVAEYQIQGSIIMNPAFIRNSTHLYSFLFYHDILIFDSVISLRKQYEIIYTVTL